MFNQHFQGAKYKATNSTTQTVPEAEVLSAPPARVWSGAPLGEAGMRRGLSPPEEDVQPKKPLAVAREVQKSQLEPCCQH